MRMYVGKAEAVLVRSTGLDAISCQSGCSPTCQFVIISLHVAVGLTDVKLRTMCRSNLVEELLAVAHIPTLLVLQNDQSRLRTASLAHQFTYSDSVHLGVSTGYSTGGHTPACEWSSLTAVIASTCLQLTIPGSIDRHDSELPHKVSRTHAQDHLPRYNAGYTMRSA